MITIHDVEQKSDLWFALKAQNPFSSSHATAIGNQGAGLETLVWEALVNEFSIADKKQFTNEHLERGNELEPLARSIYELQKGVNVTEVGFITNDKYEKAGASTDGLVDDDGCVEIKCFEDKKHLKLIHELKKTGDFTIESGYLWQMQHELLITEREWCDYIAFNPNFEMDILIKRVYPDAVMQQKLITGIAQGNIIYKKLKQELQ
jgi:exodeoxyribonuclease (lambda-induced)